MRRKRNCNRKRRSHVEHKRKQNDIRTRISVYQNIGRQSCSPESVLPYTSSREQGLWERGLNCGRKTPSWFEFSSCVCICLCVAMVHTCEMQTQAQMQAKGNLRNFLQFSVEWSLISHDFRHLARQNVVECF